MKTNTIKSVVVFMLSVFSAIAATQAGDHTLTPREWTGRNNPIVGNWKIVVYGGVI